MRRFDHVTLAVPEQLGPGPHRCEATQVVQVNATTGWALALRYRPNWAFDEADFEYFPDFVVFETVDGGRTWEELPELCSRQADARGVLPGMALLALAASLFLGAPARRLAGQLAAGQAPDLAAAFHGPLVDGWSWLALALMGIGVLAARALWPVPVVPSEIERLATTGIDPTRLVAIVTAHEDPGDVRPGRHEFLWDGAAWRYLGRAPCAGAASPPPSSVPGRES